MSRRKNFNIYSHYTYYIPGVGGMFGLILWLLVGSLLGAVVMALFRLVMNPEAAMEYGMLVSYPLQFIPAMMYASSQSRSRCISNPGVNLDSNHFGKGGGLVAALVVAVATFAAGYCSDALTEFLPQMPESLKATLEAMTEGPLWLNLICVAVFAPFFEEWLCRGMVLRGLLHRGMKPVWAIVLSAVFFAVIHANPWQAVPAFIVGMLLGYVYFKTGSLKLTMLMHCVNNAMAVLLSHIDKFEDAETWADVLSPQAFWLVFAACIIVLGLTVLKFSRIPLEEPEGNQDKVPALFEQ